MSIFHVPFPKNRNFVGRANILGEMEAYFRTSAGSGYTSTYALYGLGGVGKTQIAIQFVYEHRDLFDVVWWLQAHDRRLLIESYLQISGNHVMRGFGLPTFDENMKGNEVAKEIKRWFEEQKKIRWLLVFDNADTISEDISVSVVDLILKGDTGSVLITSRNQRINEELMISGREVTEMDEREAILLLGSSGQIEVDTDLVKADAMVLVKELGFLPLAIEQAGGYIRSHKGLSVARYLGLFEENKREVLHEGLTVSHRVYYYKDTVMTTWKMSFNDLGPLASEILSICAFLDHSAIQLDLFQNSEEVLEDHGWRLPRASLCGVERSIRQLLSCGLVRAISGNAISIHRLVQEVTQWHMADNAPRYLAVAIKLVLSKFAGASHRHTLYFSECLVYGSHAAYLAQNSLHLNNASADLRLLLERVGRFSIDHARYREAVLLFEYVLSIYDKAFGTNHIFSAPILDELGVCRCKQQRHEEAVSYLKRAIYIFRREGKDKDYAALNCMSRLGEVYAFQGEYNEANTLYAEVLETCEAGTAPLLYANLLSAMGQLAWYQGQYTAAIAYYKQALDVFVRHDPFDEIWGTWVSLCLSECYLMTGQEDEAAVEVRKAFQTRKAILGETHPHTLHAYKVLENVYMNSSLLLTATGTTEKAKRIREQVFELDNPFASKVVTEITKLYTEQGGMEQSNKMFEEMRKVQERRALSDKVNPYLFSATDRKEKERIDESSEIAALHCEVFEIRAARYGADHPATLEAMENLAEVYNELGRITEAAVLDERVTELRRRKLRRV